MASARAHGTPARYDHGPDENDQPGKGCRCTPCGKAKQARQKRYRLARSRGKAFQVDAAPVRRHVAMLREKAGADLHAIARAAGVPDRVVDHLMYGRPSGGPPSRIRRDNAAALRSVRAADLRPRLVLAVGAQRRLRGLAVCGWPVHVMAEWCGVYEDGSARIIRAEPSSRITVDTEERIRAGCAALWTRDPLAAGVPLGVVTRLRRTSAAKGWVSLLAWDDIDDPAAEPQGVAVVGA